MNDKYSLTLDSFLENEKYYRNTGEELDLKFEIEGIFYFFKPSKVFLNYDYGTLEGSPYFKVEKDYYHTDDYGFIVDIETNKTIEFEANDLSFEEQETGLLKNFQNWIYCVNPSFSIVNEELYLNNSGGYFFSEKDLVEFLIPKYEGPKNFEELKKLENQFKKYHSFNNLINKSIEYRENASKAQDYFEYLKARSKGFD